MEVKAPRRLLAREQKTVYGLQAAVPLPKRNICSFWLAGHCNRNPCRFLHARMPLSQIPEPKQSRDLPQGHKTSRTWRREADSSIWSCSSTSTQPPRKTDRSYKKIICKSSTQPPSKTDESHKNSICESSTQPPSKTDESHKNSICESSTLPPSNTDGSHKNSICESSTLPPSNIDGSHKRKSMCKSPTQPPSNIDGSHKRKSMCKSPTQPPRETDGSHKKKSICKSSNMVCKKWIDESCVHGDKCEFLHTWSCGKGFSLLTKLEGHKNAITGIALPSSSNKLVTVGKDKAMMIWDCNNGQCLSVENFEGEVDCVTTEGSFLFAGMQNTIKGWDTQNQMSINLSGSSDKVNAVVVEGDKIFAGTENGSILVWKSNASGYPEVSEPLRGHKDGVVCLRIGLGGSRMYSGSRDSTIKVWDLNTMECLETLYGHTSTVTSLLCWETYLLSGSLDGTTKAWACNENGNIEVTYTHEEGHGVITLGGAYDAEEKAILLVSCDNGCVRLYELPSFEERGRLFAKKEVCAIEVVIPERIFFTGDASGQIAVWKLDAKPTSSI